MKLELIRKYFKPDYTIGTLSVDGQYFCDTLEDRVRNLETEGKVPGKTAIPEGEYEVVVNISPAFRRKLPRLLGVPGFEGILIHRGNTAEDTSGCILVGKNNMRGRVTNSASCEMKLTEMLSRAQGRGELIKMRVIGMCPT